MPLLETPLIYKQRQPKIHVTCSVFRPFSPEFAEELPAISKFGAVHDIYMQGGMLSVATAHGTLAAKSPVPAAASASPYPDRTLYRRAAPRLFWRGSPLRL
jgi:hypothetical protein